MFAAVMLSHVALPFTFSVDGYRHSGAPDMNEGNSQYEKRVRRSGMVSRPTCGAAHHPERRTHTAI